MIELLLLSLGALTIFFAGVLLIAWVLSLKYGDHTASYPLFAVRDRLVALVVFEGLSREDPWFEALYRRVNGLLAGARLFAGPGRWRLASAVGAHLGEVDEKPVSDLPQHEPPAQIRQVLPELEEALERVASRHIGLQLLASAHGRARLARRRREARELHQVIRRYQAA